MIGIMLSALSFSAMRAEAAPLESEMQCEPFTIQISVLEGYYRNGTADLETQLNAEAAKACYGHRFTIDRSSIRRREVQLPNTGFDPKFAIAVSANVACRN